MGNWIVLLGEEKEIQKKRTSFGTEKIKFITVESYR